MVIRRERRPSWQLPTRLRVRLETSTSRAEWEFLIWLPGANEEQAAAAKAKVSESVGEIRIELTEAGTILDALSVSAGSATRHKNDLTDPEKDYEGILSEADELMYQEKKRLKGQIE